MDPHHTAPPDDEDVPASLTERWAAVRRGGVWHVDVPGAPFGWRQHLHAPRFDTREEAKRWARRTLGDPDP